MCCLFTCCGWMIDLFQRAWVFAMSCCISSAVSCAIVTASMSGVALGYNYSLAEYIELKETNVSVYLKRGVFDDEVVDEMDWRRGGGGPAAAQRRAGEITSTIPTTRPDFPFGYRRANDEGIFETTVLNPPNDLYGQDPAHRQFEGSLLKLTARPQMDAAGNKPTEDSQVSKILASYPKDSMEQLKAVQSLLNRRKMDDSAAAASLEHLMHKPMVFTMDYTGSVPMDAYSSTPPGSSNELDVIQKLLNERRMSAMKFESLRPTKRPNGRPEVTGALPLKNPNLLAPSFFSSDSARRMNNPESGGGGDSILQKLMKDPAKWYNQKTEASSENIFAVSTPAKGPLTLSHTTTRRKIKIYKEVSPPSQEGFRRAMQEADDKASTDKDDNEKQAENIINDSQKDYDEEDVKGFPVRKRRKKRNRRNIQTEHTQDVRNSKPDKISKFGAGTGLFSKLITAFMNLKFIFATDDTESIAWNVSISNKLDSNELNSMDIVTSSYVNIGASSTELLVSKIMKSTIVSS